MEMTNLKASDYDPYVATDATDRVSVEVRRRHALEDARKTHLEALDKLMRDYAQQIVDIHKHFDAMWNDVRRAAA